jgi:hypothetical protein
MGRCPTQCKRRKRCKRLPFAKQYGAGGSSRSQFPLEDLALSRRMVPSGGDEVQIENYSVAHVFGWWFLCLSKETIPRDGFVR